MNGIFKVVCFAMLFTVWSCGQKSQEVQNDEPEAEGNQALYNEVMKVHDEVMPKLDEIYRHKERLNDKIANNPDMPEQEKKEIENILAELEAADKGMWIWMREFNPIPDSEGEEKAREYLEGEMEKVKKVRDDMLNAIERAKTVK